jgi:DNA-binding MarR family transcriptional regulator
MPRRAGQRSKPTPIKDVSWLTAREEAAWRSIATLIVRLRWSLECQLERDAGLSFIEYHCLARLSEEPDHQLRMSELAAVTNASLSRLSHLAKQLEGRGLLTREPDPTDGRYTKAVLTEQGYAKLREAAPAHVEAVRRLVIDAFGPGELKSFQQACDRIVARLDAFPQLWDPAQPPY